MAEIIDIRKQTLQDERIDRYLLRQMSETEEVAFEQELKRDAMLRQRARLIARTVKAMKTADQEDVVPTASHRMVARNPLIKPKK